MPDAIAHVLKEAPIPPYNNNNKIIYIALYNDYANVKTKSQKHTEVN